MYFRAIKMNLANEGLEAKKKEEEVNSRKRKAEEDKNWEGLFRKYIPVYIQQLTLLGAENRDQRVDSWRTFAKGGKKKKSKIQVLG